MNGQEEEGQQPLVAVARAVRTRGLRGEIVAVLLTDFPQRFADVSRLIAVAPLGERLVVDLESYWFQGDRVILKLAGYNTPEAASSLVGHEFAVPEADRVQLSADEFYEWELAGCVVETVAGRSLGQVSEVVNTGGVAMLVVRDQSSHEFLIPLAESIVVKIDVEGKRIEIDPPEGLLEL
jgi:16S rRNA processing protein RimM